jgi:hypothetical protein
MSLLKLDETIFSLPRLLMTTLWPSFIMACAATVLFFSLVDSDAIINSHSAELGPEVIYSIAFFIFWLLGALTSALTALLMCKSK